MAEKIALTGKTKKVRPLQVYMESFDVITWNNGKSAPMPGKGVWSTTTICAMSELLQANGRNTVYQGRAYPTMYRAKFGYMIELEVVVRYRNEEPGSLHKREPNLPLGLLEKPRVEFYLKTNLKATGGYFNGVDLSALGDDPLIKSWNEEGVWVVSPSAELNDDLKGIFVPFSVPDWHGTLPELFTLLSQEAFVDAGIIRAGWRSDGWDMGDVKLEYCFVVTFDHLGNPVITLYLGEAPSNDEWRIRDPQGIERSKQTIRDGGSIEDAQSNYALVANAACAIKKRKLEI